MSNVGSNYVAGTFFFDELSLMTGQITGDMDMNLQKALRITGIVSFGVSFGFGLGMLCFRWFILPAFLIHGLVASFF